jgi:hypothetical protein
MMGLIKPARILSGGGWRKDKNQAKQIKIDARKVKNNAKRVAREARKVESTVFSLKKPIFANNIQKSPWTIFPDLLQTRPHGYGTGRF